MAEQILRPKASCESAPEELAMPRRYHFAITLLCAVVYATPAHASLYVDANQTAAEGGIAAAVFETIQAAVDAAAPGDVIEVAPGIYQENVRIRTPLTVRAAAGGVEVHAADGALPVFDVRADDVVIEGIAITSGNAGVLAGPANRAVVRNCEIYRNRYGVALGFYQTGPCNDCVAENNYIHDNSEGIVTARNPYGGKLRIVGNVVERSGYALTALAPADVMENDFRNSSRAGVLLNGPRIRIFRNNFIGNLTHYENYDEPGTGLRLENGYLDGGNYWDDWTGPDVNGDGVVDNPRGRDFFPVTKPNGWLEITPVRHVHNLTRGTSYPTLTLAVDDSSPGDTIRLGGGTITSEGMYYENVVLPWALTLTGESLEATLTAASVNEPTLTLASDSVVEGITITGSGQHAGVLAGPANRAVVRNCEVYGSRYGIALGFYQTGPCNECIAENNYIHDAGEGIVMARNYGSSKLRIVGNVVERSGYALTAVAPADVMENDFRNSSRVGVLVNGPDIRIFHNNFINNATQLLDWSGPGAGVIWHDGYPSGGNHFSDWTSPDEASGPNQDLPGPDGIVDLPYGPDPYPLVEPSGWIPANAPPTANAGPDLWVYPDEEFTLDGTGSSDPEGAIVLYEWSFGDGNTYAESALFAPDGVFDGKTTHSYPDEGTQTVTLTVTDEGGLAASDESLVEVRGFIWGIDNLRTWFKVMELSIGFDRSLIAKLDAAEDALAVADVEGAVTALTDLLNQLQAPGFYELLIDQGFDESIIPEIERLRAVL
jgi:nitrous oxidase accessory protein NosD